MRCDASPNPVAPVAALAPAMAATGRPAEWYVAYTDARQEALAVSHLERQGFETYLPLYKVAKKKSSAMRTPAQAAFEPMFPRYLFFKPATHRQSISVVRSTRGVHSIVRFGASFALVQPDLIDAIREHEESRNRTDVATIGTVRPGDRIRINDASFYGLEGLVHSASTQRVIVLMEILGRQTRVRLRPDAVELAT